MQSLAIVAGLALVPVPVHAGGASASGSSQAVEAEDAHDPNIDGSAISRKLWVVLSAVADLL